MYPNSIVYLQLLPTNQINELRSQIVSLLIQHNLIEHQLKDDGKQLLKPKSITNQYTNKSPFLNIQKDNELQDIHIKPIQSIQQMSICHPTHHPPPTIPPYSYHLTLSHPKQYLPSELKTIINKFIILNKTTRIVLPKGIILDRKPIILKGVYVAVGLRRLRERKLKTEDQSDSVKLNKSSQMSENTHKINIPSFILSISTLLKLVLVSNNSKNHKNNNPQSNVGLYYQQPIYHVTLAKLNQQITQQHLSLILKDSQTQTFDESIIVPIKQLVIKSGKEKYTLLNNQSGF